MPPVVIDATLRIRVIWLYSGTFYRENVLSAIIPAATTVTASTASDVASAVGSAHTSSGLAALQPAGISLDSVGVRDVRVANRPEFTASVASPGTGTGDLLAKGTALVVTERTALAGKSYRGRVFVPGFSEAANDGGGRASAAAGTAAQAFVQDIGTGLASLGFQLAVGSVKLGQSNAVQSSIVRDLVWDRQWNSASR